MNINRNSDPNLWSLAEILRNIPPLLDAKIQRSESRKASVIVYSRQDLQILEMLQDQTAVDIQEIDRLAHAILRWNKERLSASDAQAVQHLLSRIGDISKMLNLENFKLASHFVDVKRHQFEKKLEAYSNISSHILGLIGLGFVGIKMLTEDSLKSFSFSLVKLGGVFIGITALEHCVIYFAKKYVSDTGEKDKKEFAQAINLFTRLSSEDCVKMITLNSPTIV